MKQQMKKILAYSNFSKKRYNNLRTKILKDILEVRMKKLFALLLAGVMALSLAACSKTDDNNLEKDDSVKITDSLELLNTVWNSYADDDKFAVAGGDMSEENMTMDAPGNYGIDDPDAIDAALGLPASSLDKIDNAASLVHMMNANTFTCGAFHVKDKNDISAVAAEIKENIMARQWMCGFPDKLVIASVDSYIISFFGNEEIIDQFKDKLAEVYVSASVISDDPIE